MPKPLATDAPAACQSPPSLPNGDVVYSSLLVGSVANYSCNDDYIFCGLSLSSVCDLSGSWNGLNGSCERVAFYNVTPPFKMSIPGEIRVGWKAEVLGTPLNVSRIALNLLYAADIVLRIGIRFDYHNDINTVVFSSIIANKWVAIHSYKTAFPFAIGRRFNLTILMKNSEFEVYVDEVVVAARASNVSITLIDAFQVGPGCVVDSVKFFN
ncbi:uncharacterized protein LOC121380693 [Gigantopelta aegis]|uniref:uncharacterized protein LOC121380693 n=1 Tax=Gigantopelta aegis TaxID=1735272 RepID=UPI001B88BA59|nr:uncharacterized protein LOC121380693 [Gigantopelta aegis]